ncbi:unnamed protein product [Urochloa decumbens]|uniref:F-box domain-containing protein n=1 Tax=Urochloa decumbens TaxID=240449 RepID=A0ABC9A3R1_9POAL
MPPRGEAGRDRLSALPDDLLHRILRPLDARQAAGDLSLLSRRWRRVWASSPFVTFSQRSARSERFGNNLLLLRDPVDLRAFSLHSSDRGNGNFFFQHRWLRHALSRGLRVLELTLRSSSPFQVPDCLFACATLEEISLSSKITEVLAPKSEVSLPRLKKLHLEMVCIVPSAMEKFNSGWPALEDLNLSRCLLDLGSFKLSSETVKSLSITDCTYGEIHVCAPSTTSLKIKVSSIVHLSAMPSLVSAWVYVCDYAAGYLAPYASDLVAALCNAQRLELFRFDLILQDVMQKSAATEGLSFSNLESLYVGEWLVTDFYNALAFFTQRAPNLATLALDQWKLYQRLNGSLPSDMVGEKKPTTDGKLKLLSALPKNIEKLWVRLSKGDDVEEFRKMRSLLKEKTKPREMEVVWF